MKPKRWSESIQPLEDMRSNAISAAEMLEGASPGWWESDKTLRFALLYVVQVVGEAARRVPVQVRELAPEIPWMRIVGIRSFIVHEYDQLDPAIVQDVLTKKFPALVPQLALLLSKVRERGDDLIP